MNEATKRIVSAIKNNSKRMAKLQAMPSHIDRRRKANAFVIAECAAQKLQLTREDISAAAVAIAG